MASGSISLTSSKAWSGRIDWDSTPNPSGNYSEVYIYACMWKTDGYLTSSNSPTSGTITVNGESYDLQGIKEFKTEVCIFAKAVRVDHNSDGSKSISISLTCKGQANTSLSGYTLSGTGTAVLDTIPRKSSFYVGGSNGYPLGSPLEFTINPESSDFTHAITYNCGDASGTITSKTSETEVEWTPPLSLAEQNTSGTSLTLNVTLTTYSGSTAVGTSSMTLRLTIPKSVAPTVTVEVSDYNDHFKTYGAYIQGQSALAVKLTTAGVYGSDITSTKVEVDGQTLTGEDITTEVLKTAGTIQLVATVKDSRGITGTATVSLTVLAYEPPKVTDLVVSRCTKYAEADPKGAYLMAQYSAVVASLDGKNSATYTLHYKKTTEDYYTTEELDALTGVYVATNMLTVFAADTSATYDVMLVVADNFTEVTKSGIGQSISKLWSILTRGAGFAFGKVTELAYTLDMGWRIHMNGNKITGLGAPADDDDAVNKKYADDLKAYTDEKVASVYPVGAIYLSTVSTSPASLFGGTWEQIQDRFLLAAGETYTAGKTGGEATHTLTIAEMPSHNHWGVYRPYWYQHDETGQASGVGDGTSSNQLYTDNAGGGDAHNNMPPYLVVYVWKRMA